MLLGLFQFSVLLPSFTTHTVLVPMTTILKGRLGALIAEAPADHNRHDSARRHLPLGDGALVQLG